jgi:hypothetical protein
MKTTKREQELEDRVAYLEEANDRLLQDLEWERLSAQKLMPAMTQANKKAQKISSRAQTAKKQAKAQSVDRDAFGQRLDTLGHKMNAPIIALIEKGQYEKINPETLSQMIGGQVPASRFRDHLGWLRRKNLL